MSDTPTAFKAPRLSLDCPVIASDPKADAISLGWTTLVDWTDASEDDIVRSIPIETASYVQTVSQERGLNVSHIFMNDAARDQNPIATYGSENVQRLKKIAAKYDPGQVFQVLQNDGFLLRKV